MAASSSSPGAASKLVSRALRAAEDGDGELLAVVAGVAVAADQRDAVGGAGGPHAVEQRPGGVEVAAPERVHHRERAAAHGGDVAGVDHDAAPAREPGQRPDEAAEEALDREQQPAIPVRDGGAVVADAHRPAGQLEALQQRRQVGLVREPARLAQRRRQRLQCCDRTIRSPGGSAAGSAVGRSVQRVRPPRQVAEPGRSRRSGRTAGGAPTGRTSG